MALSNDECAKRFAERRVNKRSRLIEWSAANMYCDEDFIYSYGRHFPIAKYLGKISKLNNKQLIANLVKRKIQGEKINNNLFIFNNDNYSRSTSEHQGKVASYVRKNSIHFSREILAKAGIHFDSIKMDDIKDFQLADDDRDIPEQFVIQPNGKCYYGFGYQYYHRYSWSNVYDHGFLSLLPRPVKDIKQAVDLITPDEVKRAHSKGINVKTQAEYYFIPTDKTDKYFTAQLNADSENAKQQKLFNHKKYTTRHFRKYFTSQGELPRVNKYHYQVAVLYKNKYDGKLYVRGVVYHRNIYDGKSSNKFSKLKLDKIWHEVVKANEVERYY